MVDGWRDGSWDRAAIGPLRVPGICRVFVEVSRDVQLVASPGKDAPTLKDQGSKGATVKLEIDVKPEELGDLAAFLAMINPRRPGGVKEPLPIVSAQTAIAGVSHVYSPKFSIGQPDRKRGILTVPIEFVEWFPEADTERDAQQAAAPTPPAPNAGTEGGGAGALLGDGGPLGDPTVPEPDPENLGADYA